jgi:hypothetical protein
MFGGLPDDAKRISPSNPNKKQHTKAVLIVQVLLLPDACGLS